MRGELEYQSITFGECPSDYDWENIKDSVELEFLKKTDILQGTLTRLKYNIEMFDYFLTRFILNSVIRDEFGGFFAIFLSDLTTLIAIDFSSILEKSDLTLGNYRDFCNKNPTLFTHENVRVASQGIKLEFDKAIRLYQNYLATPRNKLFAHMDEIYLDKNAVDHMVNSVSVAKMKSLLQSLIKVLSSFWFAYNGKQLCFELKKGEDYKKLAYTICSAYGDTEFI